jgi:hypothetical protein
MEDGKKPWEQDLQVEDSTTKKPWEQNLESATPQKGGAEKKYTYLIEFGWFYIRINGRSIGIRNPFYWRD